MWQPLHNSVYPVMTIKTKVVISFRHGDSPQGGSLKEQRHVTENAHPVPGTP